MHSVRLKITRNGISVVAGDPEQVAAELFTFILDFRGGTYIAQSRGSTESNALHQLMSTVDDPVWLSVLHEICADDPTEVESVINVTCCSAMVGDDFAIVHVVRTVDTQL